MDSARARDSMVDSQIRTADVVDPRLIAAFRAIPRERFTPPAMRTVAYGDLELEVSPGRYLLRPRDSAKLIAALAPQPGERALEIAGATGYGAAVLARLVGSVIAHDPDASLSFAARAALEAVGVANATAVSTNVDAGWPDAAPYDVILVGGAVERVPEAWFAQLAPGGRLGVIVRNGAAGEARVYTRSQETIAYRSAFDAAPPVIPGLEKPRAFTF